MDIYNKSYKVAKRLYTIGQYARFVRPGWQRFEATKNPSNGIYVTAYKDPDTGKFAVVAMNNSSSAQSMTFSLKGFTPDSVTPYTTSETQNLAEGSQISISGSSFTFNLAANSVTTFVGGEETANPKSSKYGDLNADGKINSTDFLLMKQLILEVIPELPISNGAVAADVNGDGKVNSSDLLVLKTFVLDIISEFPAGTSIAN